MKSDVIIVQESYLVFQSHSLWNTTFKFDMEWRVFVNLTTGNTTFIKIGHLNIHFLHHTFGKRIRSQYGNLIIQILSATEISRGHNRCWVNITIPLFDKHRTRSLIDFWRITIVCETNGQSHNNENEEQIPMIQCNIKYLFYVDVLVIFIRLRIICLFLICHDFSNI